MSTYVRNHIASQTMWYSLEPGTGGFLLAYNNTNTYLPEKEFKQLLHKINYTGIRHGFFKHEAKYKSGYYVGIWISRYKEHILMFFSELEVKKYLTIL